MSEKLHKRELNKPDAFHEEGSKWVNWLQNHPQEATYGAIGVVVLLIVVGVGLELATRGPAVDTSAGAALGKAIDIAGKEVAEGIPASADGETYPSEVAKQEALAKALSDVREQHKGKPAATLAALSLADARFKLGKPDEALALYDEFLGKVDGKDPLRALALEGRAMALEAKNDLPGALAAYEKLATDLPAFADRALYGKARIFEAQQKWDDARAAYEALKKDHVESPVTRLSTDRLNGLNLAHPPAKAGG